MSKNFSKVKRVYFNEEVLKIDLPTRQHTVYLLQNQVQVFDSQSGEIIQRIKTCNNYLDVLSSSSHGDFLQIATLGTFEKPNSIQLFDLTLDKLTEIPEVFPFDNQLQKELEKEQKKKEEEEK